MPGAPAIPRHTLNDRASYPSVVPQVQPGIEIRTYDNAVVDTHLQIQEHFVNGPRLRTWKTGVWLISCEVKGLRQTSLAIFAISP